MICGATAVAADTTGVSTLDQTIIGDDQDRIGDPSTSDFSFLELGPGERYVVRENLAGARQERANRRRSLIYSGQITDFQLKDEESPARVEFLDPVPGIEDFEAAHRPQEALLPHEADFTVRQMNRFTTSLVRAGDGSRAQMANTVLTGDLADNQHLNETEWVLRLLEGGRLNPNSGSTDQADYRDEPSCTALTPQQRSDLRAEASEYTGVQDYEDYEPLAPSDEFYDPEDVRGDYATNDWPRYLNLLDEAQEPFQARGLDVPSYIAPGNHDGLAQGNEDATAPFEAIGTGCLKPFPPINPFTGGVDLGDGSLFDDIISDPQFAARQVPVPPDEDRQYVDKEQYKAVFASGDQPDDHGFGLVEPDELRASNGTASYYSFEPKPGMRYIVLDTISEGGTVAVSSRGNIDDPQWRWLQGELRRAERRDELVIAWAHHATDSLDANVPDEAAAPCAGRDEHGHGTNPGCDRDPRSSTPLHLGPDLVQLFHRFPHVIAFVAGHSHNNRIEPFEDADGSGDFWQIRSPAVADWPAQHRLIEVMDNRDGTLSIFATLLDHEAPSGARRGGNVQGASPAQLASIGRTIEYNDPQEGPDGSQGERTDRNAELLLQDPRERDRRPDDDQPRPDDEGPPQDPPGDPVIRDGAFVPDDGGQGGNRRTGDQSDVQAVAVGAQIGTGGDDDLPFTGLTLAWLALVGMGLAVAGVVVRRRTAG